MNVPVDVVEGGGVVEDAVEVASSQIRTLPRKLTSIPATNPTTKMTCRKSCLKRCQKILSVCHRQSRGMPADDVVASTVMWMKTMICRQSVTIPRKMTSNAQDAAGAAAGADDLDAPSRGQRLDLSHSRHVVRPPKTAGMTTKMMTPTT